MFSCWGCPDGFVVAKRLADRRYLLVAVDPKRGGDQNKIMHININDKNVIKRPQPPPVE